jgi:hypothetical protein
MGYVLAILIIWGPNHPPFPVATAGGFWYATLAECHEAAKRTAKICHEEHALKCDTDCREAVARELPGEHP